MSEAQQTRRAGSQTVSRALRVLLALALLLALGGVVWTWTGAPPALALVVAGLAVGLHLGGLALEFLLVPMVRGGSEPAPAPRATELARAFVGETVAAHRSFFGAQAFRHERWPDRPARTATPLRGVVLVHGFVCNRGLWNGWLARLAREGNPCIAPSLAPVFGGIDAYVNELERCVRELEHATGMAPVLVGHSMGGLVLRAWWVRHGRAGRIHHAITIGTPHRGTWLARFAFSRNGRQMRAGSRWLQQLEQAEAAAPRMPLTAFYSACDNIVMPPALAVLPWADCRHLPACGHVQLVEHDAPWQAARQKLQT